MGSLNRRELMNEGRGKERESAERREREGCKGVRK